MNKRLVSIIVLCALFACFIWIFPTRTRKIASLNAVANDTSADPDVRCLAISRLFEDFVQPGCTIAELRTVLTDLRWLERTNLHGVVVIGGAIPVDFGRGPVFYILLRTAASRGDAVYLAFSENGPSSDDECLALLKHGSNHDAQVRLVEFAVCWQDGYTDVFTKDGKRSDRPKAWEHAWYWLRTRVLHTHGR